MKVNQNLLYQLKKCIMNNKLKQRIKEFNKIKFNQDKGKRIIIATLKPTSVTIGG